MTDTNGYTIIKEDSNYQYFCDIDNSAYAVSKETGEITEAINTLVPIGSILYTPAQQEAYKEYQRRKDKKACRSKMLDELGYFYFVATENQLGKLSAESAARLIFLCTFLDYDNNFMLSQRQRMKKSDLQSVLGLSTGTTHKFWHEVSPLYIIDDAEGLKLANADIVRGEIIDKQNYYQRFYTEAIRKLYRTVGASKHRYLGRVYQILPFMNLEYNIICWNPYETVLDDVKPLTVAEFCELIGYDAHDYKKLLVQYKQITFDAHGKQEYFLNCVTNDGSIIKAKLFVNPLVLYCGSNYKKVEILGAFCKV